ncbi:unnamed protein product [Brassica rapa]|uniref:Uncharacterized protein n=1 Tax=Brassica campestris TaxID=3711 RepID=A0A8D9FZM4_BRACM|nr:unnamed protein product [Brassica rapa]
MVHQLSKISTRTVHGKGQHADIVIFSVYVVVTKSMVQPESHQTVQTGHLGGTSDREGVQPNWNRGK